MCLLGRGYRRRIVIEADAALLLAENNNALRRCLRGDAVSGDTVKHQKQFPGKGASKGLTVGKLQDSAIRNIETQGIIRI